MIVRRGACLLVLIAMVALAWLACEEQASHLYAGRLYDPDADCLYPSTWLDSVLGSAEVSDVPCDAHCITDVDGQVFLSASCPPMPVEFYGASKAPTCGAALAARCRLCLLDGGSVRVICDAGGD